MSAGLSADGSADSPALFIPVDGMPSVDGSKNRSPDHVRPHMHSVQLLPLIPPRDPNTTIPEWGVKKAMPDLVRPTCVITKWRFLINTSLSVLIRCVLNDTKNSYDIAGCHRLLIVSSSRSPHGKCTLSVHGIAFHSSFNLSPSITVQSNFGS